MALSNRRYYTYRVSVKPDLGGRTGKAHGQAEGIDDSPRRPGQGRPTTVDVRSPHREASSTGYEETQRFERAANRGWVTEGRFPEDYLPQGRHAKGYLPEDLQPEGRLPKVRLSKDRFPEDRLPKGHLTENHLTEDRLTEAHLTEDRRAEGGCPKDRRAEAIGQARADGREAPHGQGRREGHVAAGGNREAHRQGSSRGESLRAATRGPASAGAGTRHRSVERAGNLGVRQPRFRR